MKNVVKLDIKWVNIKKIGDVKNSLDNSKRKVKIRNNPRRKGRVYSD